MRGNLRGAKKSPHPEPVEGRMVLIPRRRPRTSLSLRPEERLQQLARPHFADTAMDFRPVVAGRLPEDARPMLDAAPLRVKGAEIESADAGEGNRLRAHRAGLERD